MCRTSPAEKGKFIKIILALLQSSSTAVVYECAVTLTSLSSAPSAIRAAANCYCQLLVAHSDNNVKLIVLDRLQELKEKHTEVMQEAVMDILRALVSPNIDIRKKTLDISMDLVTGRNIDEVGAPACARGLRASAGPGRWQRTQAWHGRLGRHCPLRCTQSAIMLWRVLVQALLPARSSPARPCCAGGGRAEEGGGQDAEQGL